MSVNVLGVRFREAAKIYYFAPPEEPLYAGEYVVVPTAHGEEMARVVITPDADAGATPHDVKAIRRMATGEDRARAAEMQDRADAMLQRLRAIVGELELPMYVAACQVNLEGTEGTAFFQADDPVDFRSVQETIEIEYEIRLHMMQVGPRDRAKLVDGYDICGQRLCCSSWMTAFPKVGIRMAKAQDLSLNPDKISGVCGRLFCCLTFEYDIYRDMRGKLPKLGKQVSTPVGQGRVVAVNVPKESMTVQLDDSGRRVEVPAIEMGLSVRVESAPNEAIEETVRARGTVETTVETGAETGAETKAAGATDEGQAAPRARRRRRRRRRSWREGTPATTEGAPPTSEGAEGGGGRHRRRRKPAEGNGPPPAAG